MFAQIDGGTCNERLCGDCVGHATIYWERVELKTAFSTMREIIMFGNFF